MQQPTTIEKQKLHEEKEILSDIFSLVHKSYRIEDRNLLSHEQKVEQEQPLKKTLAPA